MIKRIIVGVLTTNCYIYYTKNNDCVIIDPGWDEYKIMARVQKLNLNPLGIVLTHGHFDHTGAMGRLKNLFSKKGKTLSIAIHEADKFYIGENSGKANQAFFYSYGISTENSGNSVLPNADCYIKENDTVFNTDLQIIETPGHTPGSVCLYSREEGLLFSGDTLFNGGIGRTDFPGSSEQDLITSIRTKIMTLPPTTAVYPGHGPETNIQWEQENNPFIG